MYNQHAQSYIFRYGCGHKQTTQQILLSVADNNASKYHAIFGINVTPVSLCHISDPVVTVTELDMPSDANCSMDNFSKTTPIGGVAITCEAELEYSSTAPQDGDK